MPSKRDDLLTTLAGQGYTSGSVSDRLYAREKDTLNPSSPLSLSDLLAANGTDKKTIQ